MPRNIIMKVCLLGDGAVGKTSLIRKFVYDEFDDKYLMTIGNKVTKKAMGLECGGQGFNLTLMINDIVGQIESDSIHRQYYRGSKGALFVFDLTRPETLESMDAWLESFKGVAGDVPVIMLGNKADLEAQRRVQDIDMLRLSEESSSDLLMTSAKTGENVEEAFQRLGRVLCQGLS